MIRNILFDMDGVLIDSEPVHFQIWRQVFHNHGLDIDFDHYQHCVGSNLDSLFLMAEKYYGVTFDDRPSLIREFRALKEPWFHEKGVPPIPGVQTAVRTLYQRGYRMAVASSSALKYIEFITESLGIQDCFDALCTGQAVPHPKPAPDIFLFAADALGAKPQDCLVIEDSRNGSVAARDAGMTCWGFRNPSSGNQDLSTASWIFDAFHQILGRLPEVQ